MTNLYFLLKQPRTKLKASDSPEWISQLDWSFQEEIMLNVDIHTLEMRKIVARTFFIEF